MTGSKATRRKNRRAKKERWCEVGRGRVVETLRRWGIEGKLPVELVDALAATRRRRIFDPRERRPEVEPVLRAIERRLAEPVAKGGLSPLDFFELVVPAIARLPRGLPGIPRADALFEIRDRFHATLEVFEKERNRRAWGVALEHGRLDHAIYVVRTKDGEFRIERQTFEERTFEVDGAARRVWRVVDWPEGPVFVQAHALHRAEERLPYERGFAHIMVLTNLARPAIVGRHGDSLEVELRVAGTKLGYLLVTELAGGPDGKRRHLVRTFETLGMRGTPEGRKLREELSEAEIRGLGLDTIEAFASDAVKAQRPQLEKLGFGPNFEVAEELTRRPA